MGKPNDHLIPTTREEREEQDKKGLLVTLKQFFNDPLGKKRKQEIAQNLQDQADQQLWDEYQTQCNHIKSVIAGKTSLDEFVPHYDIEHYQKLHDKITGMRTDYQSWRMKTFINWLSNPKMIILINVLVTKLGPDHPFSKWRSQMVEAFAKEQMSEQEYYSSLQELTLSLNTDHKKEEKFSDFFGMIDKFQEIEKGVERGVSQFQQEITLIINHLQQLDIVTQSIGSLSSIEQQVEELLINKPEGVFLATHRVNTLLAQLHEYRAWYQANWSETKITNTKQKLEHMLSQLLQNYVQFVDQEAQFLSREQQIITHTAIKKLTQLVGDDLTPFDTLIENTHQIKEIKNKLIHQVSNIDNKKGNLIDGLIQFIDYLDYQGINIENDKKKLLGHVIIPSYYTDQLKQPILSLIQKIFDHHAKHSKVMERLKLDQMRIQFLEEYKQFEEFQKTFEALQKQGKTRLQGLSDSYRLQLQNLQSDSIGTSDNPKTASLSDDIGSQTSIDKLIQELHSIKPDVWDATLIEKPIPANTLADLVELYHDLLVKLGLPTITIADGSIKGSDYKFTTQDIYTLQRSIHTWIVALISGDINNSVQSGSLNYNDIIMNYSCHTTGMIIELSYDIFTKRLIMIDNRLDTVSNEWLKNKNNQSRTQLRKVFYMAEEHLTSGTVKLQTHNGLTESYFNDKHLEGKTDCLAHQGLTPHPNWTQGEYRVDGKPGANQYKTLADYKNNDYFFGEEGKAMINTTQALVYKGVMDGTAGNTPEEQKKHLDEFIEMMKTQCYDNGYEWSRKQDFIRIMDIYFPVDQVETKNTKSSRLYGLFGMMLLTGWELGAWFQEGNEMRIDKDGNLMFDNKSIGVSRSAMKLFANYRGIDNCFDDGFNMSPLFSRSSRMMSS